MFSGKVTLEGRASTSDAMIKSCVCRELNGITPACQVVWIRWLACLVQAAPDYFPMLPQRMPDHHHANYAELHCLQESIFDYHQGHRIYPVKDVEDR